MGYNDDFFFKIATGCSKGLRMLVENCPALIVRFHLFLSLFSCFIPCVIGHAARRVQAAICGDLYFGIKVTSAQE